MSKIGLYVVDATVDNSTVSDAANLTWHRKALYYDGKLVDRTVQETNNAGLYVKDNKLMLDGNSIARSDEAASMSVDNETVKFGDSVVASNNICVNITLQDYNNLRAGKFVEGYANYSEDTVYFIVTDDRLDEVIEYDENLVRGHKDIIYNSFIPKNIVDGVNLGGITDLHNGESAASLITAKNFKDPRNFPDVAPREFEIFINDGENGPMLNIGYYVDTVDYASNCPKAIDEENYTGIGDTFTTIIENEYGEEIFRRTTYAGEFKVECPLIRNNSESTNGNHITGKTWFSIRTIDSQGRESVTLFYDVYVKTPFTLPQSINATTCDSEGKYIMTKQDLVTYGFIVLNDGETIDDVINNSDGIFTFAEAGDPGDGSVSYATDRKYSYSIKRNSAQAIGEDVVKLSNGFVQIPIHNNKNNIKDNPEYRTTPPVANRKDIYDNYTGDKRNNYFAGYRNKMALEKLLWDKKAAGYTGVILYNNNPTPSSYDDDNNTVYLVDNHTVPDNKRLITGAVCEEYNPITSGLTNYLEANPTNYPNSVFKTPTTYYILRTDMVDGVVQIKYPYNNIELDKSGSTYSAAAFDTYKSNCTVQEIIDGVTGKRYVKYCTDTWHQDELRDGETIDDWIFRDGAGIASHWENEQQKIHTGWSYNLKDDEVWAGGIYSKYTKLRVILLDAIFGTSINSLVNDTKSVISAPNLAVCPKSNYCYLCTKQSVPSSRRLYIPDNFTLDLNGCTILPTFMYDSYRQNDLKPTVLALDANINTHIVNGKVVGFYGLDLIKESYLYEAITKEWNAMMESHPTITFAGSTLCSVRNIQLENSAAYELACGILRKRLTDSVSNVQLIPQSSSESDAADSITMNYIAQNGTTVSDNIIRYVGNNDEYESVLSSNDIDNIGGNCDVYLATNADFKKIKKVGSDTVNPVRGSYTRRGFSSTAMPIDRMLLYFGNTDTNYYSGKFPYYFIHFYKYDNGTYTYIRSYKSRDHNSICIPKDTTHCKISVYIVGKEIENTPTPVIREVSSGKYLPVGIKFAALYPFYYTSGSLIQDVTIKRTKAGAIVGPSVGSIVRNVKAYGSCELFDYNSVDDRGWHTMTYVTMHYEENQGICNHVCVDNLKTIDDPLHGPCKRGVNAGNARYFIIRNCDGISVSSSVNGFIVKDTKLKGWALLCRAARYNNYTGIIKNVTSDMRRNDIDGMTFVEPFGAYNHDTNYCAEPMQVNVALNDVMCNSKKAISNYVYGRSYNVNGNVYGSKIESLVEQQEINA